MFYVYQLRANDEDEPFYIGKSFVGSQRLCEHLSETARGFKRMKHQKIKSILERGAEIREEVLHIFDVEAEAHEKERELIALYGRRDNKTGFLTNHTDGGEGTVGRVVTEETRLKMSNAKMGNKINVGRKRPDFAEKWKKSITAFNFDGTVVGHYQSSREAAETLNVPFTCISDVCNGKIQTASDSTGKRYQFKFGTIVESIGTPTYNRGKGKVIQLALDGAEVAIYDSAKQASMITGIAPQSIRACILGKAKTAGNFRWQQQSTG